MRQPDVVLLHPPSVWDFRERPILHGPISDVIPSSPVFEMYPVGFLTLAAFLRRHGYRVRIVNLALLMLRRRRFDPARFLRRLRPVLFGIDLHWLPHAHGSAALAALLKSIHPTIPIAFGGISATYFHRELIEDPAVDFVLRGAVTEPGFVALLRELEVGRRFGSVAGLTWKTASAVHVNADALPPKSLDDYGIHLGMMVSSVVRSLDFWSSAPFHSWWRHPITAVFTVKGCQRGCVTCGASRPAFRTFMPGCFPIFRSPVAVVRQVNDLAAMTKAPIFIVGDIRDGGHEYAHEILRLLGHGPVSNRIIFEFFHPPDSAIVNAIDASVRHWGAELSPETHDESLRGSLGKARFTNAQMERSIEVLLASGCAAVDLFFMIGLPGQTCSSVAEMVDAIEELFVRFDRRLSAFITPMGPFLDPGSEAFEHAEAHGYRRFARTLAEHRALLQNDDWESVLSYETRWMTRAEIVKSTYDAAARLNDLKLRHGRIDATTAARVRTRIEVARSLRETRRYGARCDGLDRKVGDASEGTMNDKAELFTPAGFLRNFRVGGILRLLAREWLDY